MPEFKTIEVGYADFIEVAVGYADALVAMYGVTSLEKGGVNIDASALDDDLVLKIHGDCKQFYSIATAVAGGKTALLAQIGLNDLGFHFFLSRQSAGVGFVDLGIDRQLAADLDEVSASMGPLQVEILGRRIVLSSAQSLAPRPSPFALSN